MIDPLELRRRVRFILSARAADQTVPEAWLHDKLAQHFRPARVPVEEMHQALRWNEARGWVEKRHNADLVEDEWLLTESGRIKEGLR